MQRKIKGFTVGCFLSITVLIYTTQSAFAGTSTATSKQMLQGLVENQIIELKQGVGAAIGFIENGKVEQLFVGKTQFQGDQPINGDHLFEIGSISKTFTAIALANMVEQGKVKLSDPVGKYLPKPNRVPSKDGKKITLLDLVTHNSGLPRMPDNFEGADPQDPFKIYDAQRLYDFLNKHELTRAPGEAREYSNLGFGLLGHVLSFIDGKPYEQVINERVIKPLKLDSTFVEVPKQQQARYIDGHNHFLVATPHWNFDALAGAGAIKSSLMDMMLYLKANMAQPQNNKAITMSHQKTVDFGSPAADIGLSWIISKHANGQYIWHNGGTAGFKTFIGFDKATQKGIVMLANSFYDLETIARAYLTGDLAELYRQLEQEPLALSAEQLQSLAGDYQLAPQFVISITTDGKQLFAQATNQPKFPVFANSATEFYFKVVQAKLVFDVDHKGHAQSVTLHQNGQQMPGKRAK